MNRSKFDIFGRRVAIDRTPSGWAVFYLGEGTLRPAHDIRIPPDLSEADLPQYLHDLCHEWARGPADEVRRLT